MAGLVVVEKAPAVESPAPPFTDAFGPAVQAGVLVAAAVGAVRSMQANVDEVGGDLERRQVAGELVDSEGRPVLGELL